MKKSQVDNLLETIPPGELLDLVLAAFALPLEEEEDNPQKPKKKRKERKARVKKDSSKPEPETSEEEAETDGRRRRRKKGERSLGVVNFIVIFGFLIKNIYLISEGIFNISLALSLSNSTSAISSLR